MRSLLFATFFLSALLGFTAIVTASPPTKPNVILVLTDDQGYGDLSCHGNPVLKTPNLDALHAQGIRLTDFHVAPMCTPTRGQLMTGVDALRNGAMNVSSGRTLLRRDFPTMAEIFAANGYRTALFGKWHLGDNYPYRPQDRGFQETIWFPSSHVSSAADYFNNDYFDDVYYHNGERETFPGYCTDLFFQRAIQWMQQCASRNEPFLCYLPLNAPHAPRFVPDHYREPYRQLKREVASFFAMIACIDENLGKLDQFLRTSGLADNTIFIFMTDNGTAGGESIYNAGMRGRKIDLYEGGHRVPFFLRWPRGKLRPPGEVTALTECQDVLPTLIELCDLKKGKAHFDGVSLAKLLRGKANSLPDRLLVSQFSRMNDSVPRKDDAVVLWNKWRLISGKELYDLANDPGQQRNVFEKFPEVTRKMQAHYDKWWQGVAPHINDFNEIHVGSKAANPVMLTACDWHDIFLDQQLQIRRGQSKSGLWSIFVERDGDYEFSLRRWPIEADTAIVQGLPEYKAVDGVYVAGTALPIAQARLKIGKTDMSKPVTPADKDVHFTIPLKRGHTELQTSFKDTNGEELCGAYYVYIHAR